MTMPTDDPGELADRVLAAKPATPGPYRSEMMLCQTEAHTYSHQVSCDKVPSGLFALLKRDDADFFALAANAAPTLAAEVKRLEKVERELRHIQSEVVEYVHDGGPFNWMEAGTLVQCWRKELADLRRTAANNAAAGERDAGRGEEGELATAAVAAVVDASGRSGGSVYMIHREQFLALKAAAKALPDWDRLLAALGLPPRSAGETG